MSDYSHPSIYSENWWIITYQRLGKRQLQQDTHFDREADIADEFTILGWGWLEMNIRWPLEVTE